MKMLIIAHPNSKKPRIVTDAVGQLHVYVTSTPVDGKANAAVIKALAAHFDLPKSAVSLKAGHTSKQKIVEIDRGE